MSSSWSCNKCKRSFTRKNQTHNCEMKTSASKQLSITHGRPAECVALYDELLRFVNNELEPAKVEVATNEKQRYALFRTGRIFAHVNITKDCVRLAVNLTRRVIDQEPMFFKAVADKRSICHVAMVRSSADLTKMKRFLKEAYQASLTTATITSTTETSTAETTTSTSSSKRLSTTATTTETTTESSKKRRKT